MENTTSQNTCYRIPPEVVYREIDGEVVILNSDIGEFYFFSRDIKPVLDSLRQPGTLVTSELSLEEQKSLDELILFLKQKQLLDSTEASADTPNVTVQRAPQFLRKGERTLDEIADDVALLTTTTA